VDVEDGLPPVSSGDDTGCGNGDHSSE
jgi:hypothetical protein